MQHSYLYTKRFLDRQIKILGEPLRGSDDVVAACDASGVSAKQLAALLAKLNVLIKRHNKTVFANQIVTQITQQVLKAERSKLEMIHERLGRIQLLIRPVLVPNETGAALQELDQLVSELPEGKYLFVNAEGSNSDEEEEQDEGRSEDESNILVHDDQERVEIARKNTLKTRIRYQAQKEQARSSVLEEYEEVRKTLIQLNETLQFKSQKLQYLQTVRDGLMSALGVVDVPDMGKVPEVVSKAHSHRHVNNEMNKFQILVDSIKFKTRKDSNIVDVIQKT